MATGHSNPSPDLLEMDQNQDGSGSGGSTKQDDKDL